MGLITPITLPTTAELGPVHFIAIGGSGMNGIASVMAAAGLPVSGSDRQDSKYLRALEDERFELLPAQTYVKGFLRSYAEYLGLDGQLYVDEYNSRYIAGEDEAPLRARRTRQSQAHRRGRVSFVTGMCRPLPAKCADQGRILGPAVDHGMSCGQSHHPIVPNKLRNG